MRYIFFITWYHQWFKNQEGIKGFAHQVINWLMRNTLKLASNLKKKNKQLKEKVKELTAEVNERIIHPIVDADDYPAIKEKIYRYRFAKLIFVAADFFFNFFAAKAIITSNDWISRAGQILLSLAMTYGFILLFEELFEELLYLRPYKGEHKEKRKWSKLIALTLFAIVYEIAVYYLCKVRGIQIEGGSGNGMISILMMLIGMISPVLAGYYDYMRGLFIGPFKNTNRIVKLKQLIAFKENRIATNLQRMENHFKLEGQRYWAYLQEFKTYKENWNKNHSIPQENLSKHYAETQESFVREAIERYKADAIQNTALESEIIISRQEQKVHDIQIKELLQDNHLNS